MTDVSSQTADPRAVAAAQTTLEAIRTAEHAHCVLCGRDNPVGFKLNFKVLTPGTVSARFFCAEVFQSYPATLHGGVVSALLDAAMANSLFSLGKTGVTVELNVRYLRPTRLDRVAEVLGIMQKASWPLFQMAGELRQDGAVLATAEAKFVDRRYAAGTGRERRP
jgi:acyl-coenzyme A thioesterase PaaI-like protein